MRKVLMHPVLLVARLWLASALVTPTGESASTCFDHPPSANTDARCAQLAAAARLRVRQERSAPESARADIGATGQGALVGLGIGLGLGLLAAAVLAHGCEENSGRCTVVLIVGGSALGAGIGAAVGAAVGRD